MGDSTPRVIGDFNRFVFPVIRSDPNKQPEPARDLTKYEARFPEGIRCPGCCGSVVAQFFDGYDYGPNMRRADYYAYTCGKLNGQWQTLTDIGPHGSIGYIDVADPRPLQAALDEEFAKLQTSRQEDLDDFVKSGAESVTFTRGCGTVVTYVPQGPLPATAHGIDCKCRGKP